MSEAFAEQINTTQPLHEQIGRYQLLSILGEGSMGVVYRTWDPHLEREVALKIVNPTEQIPANLRGLITRMLVSEARMSARFNHPGVVQVYDVGEYEGHPYIVFELMQGTPLSQLLNRNYQFSHDQVVAITHSLLDALAYIHDQGVLHLDLKPGNIMVGADIKARIMDFGISRSASEIKLKSELIMGTPYYMSPEQIQGLEVGPQSDIFSVGVIVYKMLCGRLPFISDDIGELKRQVIFEPHQHIQTINPEIEPFFCKYIDTALDKQPDNRFANAREMLDSLNYYIHLLENRNKFKEGTLVCWNETCVGMIKELDNQNRYDMVYVLSQNGSLLVSGISLSAFEARRIGRVPHALFNLMEMDMMWDPVIVKAHLFDEEDEKLIPEIQPDKMTSQELLQKPPRPARSAVVRPVEQQLGGAPPPPTPPASVRPAASAPIQPETPLPARPAVPISVRPQTPVPGYIPAPPVNMNVYAHTRNLPQKTASVKNVVLMDRGTRFSIQFNHREWEGIYWGRNAEGSIVAHESRRGWELIYLDLVPYKDSLVNKGVAEDNLLLQIERAILERPSRKKNGV